MLIPRTADEVNDVMNEVLPAIDTGDSRFKGMSYEQGIEAALMWVLGNIDEEPYPES